MKTIKAKITFIEPILGSLPNNKELYSQFIASKAPDASTIDDEIAELGEDAVTERGTTVFPGTIGIKGYLFKEACKMCKMDPSKLSSKLTAHLKKIDGNVFVYASDLRPSVEAGCEWKKLYIQDAFPIDTFERPLRAQTAQGERISLARSERIHEGASITCDIVTLLDNLEPMIREWLDYGVFKGLGQFRNAGYGRFVWEELDA